MISLVVVILLVSDGVGTAMVPLIIVGATSNKSLNVMDSRCNSVMMFVESVDSYNYFHGAFFVKTRLLRELIPNLDYSRLIH